MKTDLVTALLDSNAKNTILFPRKAYLFLKHFILQLSKIIVAMNVIKGNNKVIKPKICEKAIFDHFYKMC